MQKKKVLIIDDDSMQLRAANLALRNDYDVMFATSGENALEVLKTESPDIILLDIEMPYMDGYECLRHIKSFDKEDMLPVIFLTSNTSVEAELRGLALGAYDFIKKPFNKEIMKIRIQRTLDVFEAKNILSERALIAEKNAKDSLEESYKDALTGLWNRKYIEKYVNSFLENQHDGCLMMIDMDNFKGINDNYGHDEGDNVLKTLADILTSSTREKDVACRLGGDEFILFLHHISTDDQAKLIAERILFNVRKQISDIYHKVQTSVSIGVAYQSDDIKEFREFYEKADALLYKAKENGKNNFAIEIS